MKKVDYAEIEITITAPESEINSSKELELSDEVGQIEYDLEEWLKKRLASTPFGFRVGAR